MEFKTAFFFINKHDLTWPSNSEVGKASISMAILDKKTKTQKNHVNYTQSLRYRQNQG